MTIVIHAGLKKCGSSSIHSFLKANRETLQKLNVYYPGPGRVGTNLAHELRGGSFDSTQGTLAGLAETWGNVQSGTLVLSSEMLEETEPSGAQRLREAFLARKKSENFLIVLIIRDLIDMVPSIYAQKVKDARTVQSFDEFFDFIIEQRRVNYFQTASRWANAFGWDAIRIRLLEREYLINNDLLDDFLSLLSIDGKTDPAAAFQRPDVSNVAPGWRVLESLRALRGGFHPLEDGHPLARAVAGGRRVQSLGSSASQLGEKFDWNQDRGLYLTQRQAARCLKIYESAISSLNRKLSYELPRPANLRSRAFRPREFVPDISRIAPGELRAFYQALWRLVSKKNPRANQKAKRGRKPGAKRSRKPGAKRSRKPGAKRPRTAGLAN